MLRENKVDAVLREKKILLQLRDSKHAVNLLATFQSTSSLFFVTELCTGGPIQAKLQSESEILSIVSSLLDALLFLRGERVVHRDIKPENILLTGGGAVKLADFGCATLLSEQSDGCPPERGIGSPLFSSPQVLCSLGPVHFGSDLWSAGCVSYFLIHGKSPFDYEETEYQCMKRVESCWKEKKVILSKELDECFFRNRGIDADAKERILRGLGEHIRQQHLPPA